MGCAHLSSFTSLRRPPAALGCCDVVARVSTPSVVVVDQGGEALCGAK